MRLRRAAGSDTGAIRFVADDYFDFPFGPTLGVFGLENGAFSIGHRSFTSSAGLVHQMWTSVCKQTATGLAPTVLLQQSAKRQKWANLKTHISWASW